ncbi:MAG: Type 1 glutamine amidotransferase-like domain-containing protein [Actinomycetota bacterium]
MARDRRATRLFALLGSGEFEPWAAEADRWLLDRATGDGSVLLLPMASAPEGDEVFDRWGQMGLDHYRGMGVRAEILPLKTREDAEREDLAGRLSDASEVFFSGGNPAFLTASLRDTTFWRRLVQELDRGLAYGGCSAGVAVLGEVVPDSRHLIPGATSFPDDLWSPGLGLFPRVTFSPHWDTVETFYPGARGRIEAAVPKGSRLVGLDERTAMLGDGREWTVVGDGAVYVLEDGRWTSFPAGTSFTADLTAG